VLGSCAGPLAPSPAKVYRIGWLTGNTKAEAATVIDAFRQGMRDLGYVEGTNLILEIRYTEGHAELASALAAELVGLRLDLIASTSTNELLALKQATSTIPIVIAGATDPVGDGVVASLARPGGNITGTTNSAGPEIAQRRLQLLKETIPGAARVAFLFNAAQGSEVRGYEQARAAAAALGIDAQAVEVRAPGDFAGALAAAARGHPDAIYVGGSVLLGTQRQQILDFIAANRLPSMFSVNREYVDRGGLMLYGQDLNQVVRAAAKYVDRILKGADPAVLPIEQPAKYDFIINMKTAKALGITIPSSVLAQATELIQ